MLDYYIIDNFIDEKYVDKILDGIKQSSYVCLDGKKEKHLIGKTHYEYNVHRDSIRDNKELRTHVFEKLNNFYLKELNKTCDAETLNPLNFFTKSFNSHQSFYDLHTEDSKYFGDIVFMLYLNDEADGELVLPNFDDSKALWTKGFESMMQKLDVKFVENTIEITPKRNRCVFVKVGIAHYVKPCSGKRYALTGWSFASDEYYKKFYNK